MNVTPPDPQPLPAGPPHDQRGEPKPIGVVLVDPDDAFRADLCRLLAPYDDIRILGQMRRGEEALRRVSILRPRVVILDFALPGIGGLETVRRLLAETPSLAMLMLTGVQTEEEFFAAVGAGVSGYLLKPIEAAPLHTALRALARGGAVIAPHLAARLADRFATLPSPDHGPTPPLPLTAREREVLTWVVQGYTNEEIAEALRLSAMTVKVHVSNIFGKLGLRNRQQLAAFAVKKGLVRGPCQPPPAGRDLAAPERTFPANRACRFQPLHPGSRQRVEPTSEPLHPSDGVGPPRQFSTARRIGSSGGGAGCEPSSASRSTPETGPA